jgi:hypothetical protein
MEDNYKNNQSTDIDINEINHKRDLEIKETIKHSFENKIITYKDPLSYNFDNHDGTCSIINSKINNFSGQMGNISLCDYKQAFTKPTDFKLETIIIDKKDTDQIDLSYKNLISEREQFNKEISSLFTVKNDDETLQLKFNKILENRKKVL